MENVQVQDNSTHTSSIFVLLEYLKWDTHHIPSVAFWPPGPGDSLIWYVSKHPFHYIPRGLVVSEAL